MRIADHDMTTDTTKPAGRWLHRWALLTVGVTALQLVLGAVVTSFRVGMADPVWPTLPWHLLLISWHEPSAGFLIEHTHRLTGHLVGTCAIVLAVWAWLGEPRRWLAGLGLAALLAQIVSLALCFGAIERGSEAFTRAEARLCLTCLATCLVAVGSFLMVAVRLRDARFWVRWLTLLTLAGVMVQGLLGGFRVKLNAWAGPELAIVHGCSAQALFALLAAVAVVTSPGWLTPAAALQPVASLLRLCSLLAVALVFVQMVLGALVRHTDAAGWGQAHLLFAFVVVAVAVGLLGLAFQDWPHLGGARAAAVSLALLLVVQLFLGVEAWMFKFASGGLPELAPATLPRALVRTSHVLVGAGILAATVVVAMQVRRLSWTLSPATLPAGRLEGAA